MALGPVPSLGSRALHVAHRIPEAPMAKSAAERPFLLCFASC